MTVLRAAMLPAQFFRLNSHRAKLKKAGHNKKYPNLLTNFAEPTFIIHFFTQIISLC